ncbi:unnamed protein product [Clonostachys byssicola]|uniref:Uncharacterized protein n=1 Tax=Clonostachys byssicola TaxID=160290 RepID=A0A9N9U5K6_9HYPO|nr:unnamed protein product [Clonostachys byssicola]
MLSWLGHPDKSDQLQAASCIAMLMQSTSPLIRRRLCMLYRAISRTAHFARWPSPPDKDRVNYWERRLMPLAARSVYLVSGNMPSLPWQSDRPVLVSAVTPIIEDREVKV